MVSGEFFELRANGHSARVWRHWVPLDDAVTLRLALDKLAVHEMLTAAGLPLPEHHEFDASHLDGAVEFLERAQAAVRREADRRRLRVGHDDRRAHAASSCCARACAAPASAAAC